MGRDMDDTDILVRQHHRILLRSREGGIDLCMTVIMVSCKVQSLFVEGGGHRTVHLLSHGEVDGLLDILEGSIATLWLYLAELEGGEVDTLHIIDIDGTILKLSVLHALYGIHL